MNTPLYNELVSYSKNNKPFHMPGHKFGKGGKLRDIDLLALDNTEAFGMDNLYVADGIIKQAMDLMANFYGSQKSIFLTNGSTSGILASILATCKEGDEMIISRNSHHSVWSALILAGVTPIYLTPNHKEGNELLSYIDGNMIKETLELYPNVKGALIVSPTYEGMVSNIQEIADILHDQNKILIVDEAHGAHFAISNDFPTSSVNLGADIVINSMHKTLPALTQSGLLHICSDRVLYKNVISSLRMIQTSSPSYMMMGVMDYTREYIIQNRQDIQSNYVDELIRSRSRLVKELKVLTILDRPRETYDYSKIIISTKTAIMNGYALASKLYDNYNITVEAEFEEYIIIMTTMADDNESLEYLVDALINIDKEDYALHERIVNKYNLKEKNIKEYQKSQQDLFSDNIHEEYILNLEIVKGICPRKIYNGTSKWISIEESKGKIAAKNIMLYPPGIPIVCIGEEISNNHIDRINKYANRIQGIEMQEEKILLYVCTSY